jgi:hypothetical protein
MWAILLADRHGDNEGLRSCALVSNTYWARELFGGEVIGTKILANLVSIS